MAGSKYKRLYGLSVYLVLAALLTSCEFSGTTSGDAEVDNRGRTASSGFSTITGTGGTSTTAAIITVTLLSEQGFPLFNVVPTFTVSPLSSNDTSFTCGATNAFGTASCSFRSLDTGVSKTLLLTSPVTATGNAITFTQSASQLVITTQPNTNFPTNGKVPLAANFGTQGVVSLRDPLNAVVTGDSSTLITATLNTVSTTTSGTPTLFKNDVACSAPCQITAASGVANFGTAGNQLSTNFAGTFTLTYSGTNLTSVTSNQFQTRPGDGASIEFTTQPDTQVAALENFNPMPIVSIKDSGGNIVSTDPGNNDDDANIVMSLIVPATLTATLLGNTTKKAQSGVADYAQQSLRVDTEDASSLYQLRASATLGAGAVQVDSNTFEVTNVGIPSKVVFSTEPSSKTTNGVVLGTQPVLTLQDFQGNTVTSENTRTVTLTIVAPAGCTGGAEAIGGTVTRTFLNGVATFTDITLTRNATAGCDFYQIAATASDSALVGADPNIDVGTSENVQVGNAGTLATTLVWDATRQPSTTGQNVTIASSGNPLRVLVQDGAANTVTSDFTTTATVSISTGTGTLSGTTTRTASAGVITFDDLKINTVGTKILTAASTGLTSGSSNSFVINTSGTASRLSFSVQPTSETAGTAFTTQPVVQVVDDNGALVADADGITVQITCSNPSTCNLIGSPTTAITVSGVASFTGSNMQITTPSGNNVQLTATVTAGATGITAANTPGTLTIAPAAADSGQSSIAASAPSAANTADGVVVVFIKDQFGNARVGDSVVLTKSASNPGATACNFSCSATDSTGRSDCIYSCDTAGAIVTIGITTPAGIGKTSVVGIP